jgi:plastocyanin
MTSTTQVTSTTSVTTTSYSTNTTSSSSESGTPLTVVPKDTFAFDPASISVKPGQEFHITLDNTAGHLDHRFVVLNKGVTKTDAISLTEDTDPAYRSFYLDAHAGAKAANEFMAPTEPGEYLIVCDEAGHAAGGMFAVLTVK